MAASVAVAAEVVAVALRLEGVPEAPVVAVLAASEALEAPEARDWVLPVSGVPVAVGEVRRG